MKYDVVIIGAGSAGLSARSIVSRYTDNYLVIDGGTLGTTCARVGCMPSKVFIQVAEDFERRRKFSEQGILGQEQIEIDLVAVMKHVRKLRDRFVRAVLGGMNSWKETHFLQGYARFIAPHKLQVYDQEIEAEKFIIATGSKPKVTAPFQGHEKYLVTTDEFFELESLKGRWAVLGVGVIGLELGQAMTRLGVQVTGIGRRPSIAGITDPEVNKYAVDKFSKLLDLDFDGVRSVREVKDGLEITLTDRSITVDRVLMTPGRAPVWQNLGLEQLGVTSNIPAYDPETLQLKAFPHIYVAGDNLGVKQILHEASDEGKIAGFNAIHGNTKFNRRTPLMITFCEPNICTVGYQYQQLVRDQIDFKVGEVSFEGQGRSIVKLKELGLLRIYGATETGTLLGAEMMGPSCEHIAHLLSWAISAGMTVNQALSMPFYHPVVEEGLRTALRDLRAKVAEPKPPLEIYSR